MKRNYNNLFDSICITVLLFVLILFYCIAVYFAVITAREGTNPVVAFISLSLILFGGALICFGLLIWDGYGYWNIDENRILYKKFLRKKIIIPLSMKYNVEKKIKSALILGAYKTYAYVIEFKNQKAIIYINEKNENYLDNLFKK